MDREQRIFDNWALFACVRLAKRKGVGVEIVFHLDAALFRGTLRQLDFACKSLAEAAATAHSIGIPFHVIQGGNTASDIGDFVRGRDAKILVTDMSPLRSSRRSKSKLAETIEIPFLEVDAHNIVPVWLASPKLEYQAATFRPKIHRLLPEFLADFPEKESYRMGEPLSGNAIDFKKILREFPIDRSVLPVDWIVPGSSAAEAALPKFISERSAGYGTLRNDPNANAGSDLSPYLRYGNIAPQRVALVARDSDMPEADKAAFLEELIVRREVADNFCWYSPAYDRFEGAWNWARESLEAHWDDPREFVYSREQFERAETHDSLWNAAQTQMAKTGKMHGFLRMYWAKKILEWSENPETAIAIALYLNDRYELDGWDPNGFTGVMWSICGVHDRAWFERPVYGKIRYMNRNGCERKFDVGRYVATWTG
jgi:deoxyribodipyrimidine photo-lyase